MRHLADVAALSGEPRRQRQHLIDGLNQVLGTQIGVWLEMDNWRPGRIQRPIQQVLTSNPDPYWIQYMNDFIVHHSPHDDPYADHSIRSDAAVQLWQFEPLVADKKSRLRYGATLDMAKKLRIRDGVVSVIRAGEGGDRVIGFSLQRRSEFGRLTKRDIALARLAIQEIGGMIQRGGIHADLKVRPALPPRLREVLDRTLRGQSPGVMARAMGISIHTLREHIDRLYRHFRVHSREELMARFIR